MREQIDAEYQDRQSFAEFFSSRGWRLYSAILKDLQKIEECKIDKILNGAVDEKGLQELNICLGKKKSLQTALALKEELCEEPEENSPEEGVKT